MKYRHPAPSRGAPAPADVTLSRDDAVEQHEAHHAADKHHDDSDREHGNDGGRDQRGQSCDQGRIDPQRSRSPRVWRRPWRVRQGEVGTVASVRAKLSREQPDKPKLGPLPNAEGPEQLLLGVLDGERDRVSSGKWACYTSAERLQQQGTKNILADQFNSERSWSRMWRGF